MQTNRFNNSLPDQPASTWPAIRPVLAIPSLLCALGSLWLAGPVFAQEPLYTTTEHQPGGDGPGAMWDSAIWQLNGTGPEVAATAGNTYEAVYNGNAVGSGADTLVRTPHGNGVANIVAFPGDSLIMDTNTQMRFKIWDTWGASAQGVGFAIPTNSFPGANGLPGLVLNGGLLNAGDGAMFTILGTIYADPGTLSYLNPGDPLSGDIADSMWEGFIIAAQLSGSGGIAVVNAPPLVPLQVTGSSNTYTGQWTVMSGWLQGAGDGTSDGYNALGTNNAVSFVVDPNFAPSGFASGDVFENGPAIIDFGPSLANCGGTLTLTNSGKLYLHGMVVFSAVTIEGQSLGNGTYSYATLANRFPNNFTGLPDTFPTGFGVLVVEPYTTVVSPAIVTQPLPEEVYQGVTVSFSALALGNPLFYQWQINGAPLSNGGNISGATTPTLTISNATTANAAAYSLVVSNAAGVVTSSIVPLTFLLQNIEQADNAVQSDNPVAFYTLNEQGDPATNTAAFDIAGGHTGIYGNMVSNGNPSYAIAGPRPTDGFPDFSSTNWAALFTSFVPNSRITIPPLNLGPSSSNVTITCWINPNLQPEPPSAGVVFCRGGTTVAGINYFHDYTSTIGYTWNNDGATYGFNSGIVPPANQWSFVALIITPTNASIYVLNTNSFLMAVNPVANPVAQPFDGNTLIGDDPGDNNTGDYGFSGMIDNVAIFNTNLTQSQVMGLYSASGGTVAGAPTIQVSPASTNIYDEQTLVLTVQASGPALSYQWAASVTGLAQYTNLHNGGNISGVNTATLTIVNVTNVNALDYVCIVSNSIGVIQSSPATVTVIQVGPAEVITLSDHESYGKDWDTLGEWSDGNAASYSAVAFPGSTYEVLPGAMLRTPTDPFDAFPGNILIVDGNGVLFDEPSSGAPQGDIRFKENPAGSGFWATNFFPMLVMNGGELENGTDNGTGIVIQGVMDIVSNTPIYVSATQSGNSAPFQIQSYLTGNGSIEWCDFVAASNIAASLNITGTSNTFTGTWQVDEGSLLASGANSLGTNNITVLANGALETLYDINSPNATLNISNGVMFLHQNDTFSNVFVNGTPLSGGTHSFAQLNSSYPGNFPATWGSGVLGSTNYIGSGSITVLNTNVIPLPAAVLTIASAGSGSFIISWPTNVLSTLHLQSSTSVIGPWSNVTATPTVVNGQFQVTSEPGVSDQFYRLISP